MYIADPFETIKKLTFPTFRNLRCHSVLGIPACFGYPDHFCFGYPLLAITLKVKRKK